MCLRHKLNNGDNTHGSLVFLSFTSGNELTLDIFKHKQFRYTMKHISSNPTHTIEQP